MVRRVKPCLGTIYDKVANSEGPTRGEQKTKLPSMARTGALQEQDGPSGSPSAHPRVGLEGRKLRSLGSQTWTRESDCSRRPDGCRILFHSCMSCKEKRIGERILKPSALRLKTGESPDYSSEGERSTQQIQVKDKPGMKKRTEEIINARQPPPT